MTRSPNYNRHIKPTHRRTFYVTGLVRTGTGLTIRLESPDRPTIWIKATDDGHAVWMIELIRQGAFALPLNMMEHPPTT